MRIQPRKSELTFDITGLNETDMSIIRGCIGHFIHTRKKEGRYNEVREEETLYRRLKSAEKGQSVDTALRELIKAI